MSKELIIEIAGWVPAIVIPIATLIQLFTILINKNINGVSWIAWFLFGLANIGLYIYSEKYYALQTIIGLLGSALIDFIIVSLVLLKYGSKLPESTEERTKYGK